MDRDRPTVRDVRRAATPFHNKKDGDLIILIYIDNCFSLSQPPVRRWGEMAKLVRLA
jgi:hypothetical protein